MNTKPSPLNKSLERLSIKLQEATSVTDMTDTQFIKMFQIVEAFIQSELLKQREDIRKRLPERKPDWRGTKFREYHGFNDCHDQITKILEQPTNLKGQED